MQNYTTTYKCQFHLRQPLPLTGAGEKHWNLQMSWNNDVNVLFGGYVRNPPCVSVFETQWRFFNMRFIGIYTQEYFSVDLYKLNISFNSFKTNV